MPQVVVDPERPGRYEPRVKKRRPKQYPWLQRPRADCPKISGRRTWRPDRIEQVYVETIPILIGRGGGEAVRINYEILIS